MNVWVRIALAIAGLVVLFAYTVSYQDGESRSCVPSIGGRC